MEVENTLNSMDGKELEKITTQNQVPLSTHDMKQKQILKISVFCNEKTDRMKNKTKKYLKSLTEVAASRYRRS